VFSKSENRTVIKPPLFSLLSGLFVLRRWEKEGWRIDMVKGKTKRTLKTPERQTIQRMLTVKQYAIYTGIGYGTAYNATARYFRTGELGPLLIKPVRFGGGPKGKGAIRFDKTKVDAVLDSLE
jgi:hypothetical protein